MQITSLDTFFFVPLCLCLSLSPYFSVPPCSLLVPRQVGGRFLFVALDDSPRQQPSSYFRRTTSQRVFSTALKRQFV